MASTYQHWLYFFFVGTFTGREFRRVPSFANAFYLRFPVVDWNKDTGTRMLEQVTEKAGGIKPFSFQFMLTADQEEQVAKWRIPGWVAPVATSSMYYLGGDLITRVQAEEAAEADENAARLLREMENSQVDRAVNMQGTGTFLLGSTDFVLSPSGDAILSAGEQRV